MKALLLAAGLGSRLKPVTDHIPKCLVPINGKPLLAYWLELLSHAGIDQFYINLHYFPDAVRSFVKTSGFADKTIFLEEPELLGTGGTLKRNADLFIDSPFFLAHADNLCLTDFKSFFEAHAKRPASAALTMMTFDPVDARQCGVVVLDQNNIVTEFHEKVERPPSQLANGAVFVMEPEVAQFAKQVDQNHFEISRDILPRFTGRILAWHNGDYHLDIGTPETFKKAQDEKNLIQNLERKFLAL